MEFYLQITKGWSECEIILCGKNISRMKQYLHTHVRHLPNWNVNRNAEDKTTFKHNVLENLKPKHSNWRIKNSHLNIKRLQWKRVASDEVIFAEKTIDMYSKSFAVKIDFINTMNQIMFGMSELATAETDKFDWIRVRRTGLKNKTESSFFKFTDIVDFFENRTLLRRHIRYKIKPTFKLVTENEKDVLEYFSKYVKENEEFTV